MNNETLIKISKNKSSITIGISDFVDLLKDPVIISPISDREMLKTGLYATYGKTKIFVSKYFSAGEYEFDSK